MRSVLDASVVVKWFDDTEPEADLAVDVRARLTTAGGEGLLPQLALIEVASVLGDKKKFSSGDVRLALDSLGALGLKIVPESNALLAYAVHLSQRYELSVLDATYLALAYASCAFYITADYRATSHIPHLTNVVELRMWDPAWRRPPRPRYEARVHMNLADASALAGLPGIGPVTAARIVEFRETAGPFAGAKDMFRVPGIGRARLQAIADRGEFVAF